MLTCRETLDFLMDYLEGGLLPAERAEFEKHLAVCPPCVAYLNNYRQTIEMSKAAWADADNAGQPDVPEDLIKAVLAARERET